MDKRTLHCGTMSMSRIASRRILLWQKRCLMRESYQPPESSRRRELEGSEAMMSLDSRRELLAVTAPRYRTAHRAERSRILEEFVASTGYHRKYALTFLNHP